MNLAFVLDTAASMYPDRMAVWDAGRELTYAQLRETAARWAAFIASESPGRPVVYLGLTRLAFLSTLYGAAEAGATFVPANYRLKLGELAGVLATVAPGIIVCDERYAALAREATALASVDPRIVPSDFAPPVGGAIGGRREVTAAVGLFTSGTSAAPKLALLSHDNLTEYVLNTVEAGSGLPEETALIAAPPYHIAAVANVVSNTLRCRRIALLGQFDPLVWLGTVRAQHVTHAMVVPTMLRRILDALDEHPDLAPHSLVNLSYGGAKAPAGLVEEALERLPPTVGLVNAFGLTETSSTVALLTPDDHRTAFASADPAIRARLHSVGRPVPGVRIVIADEVGKPVAAGQEGEIWIRGRQVSAGYQDGASRVDAQGWLRTGDLGHLDSAGYLFIHGRKDDVIIRGGENLDPHEIEAALMAHPAVRDVVVVGVPDREWGQVVGALVVGKGTSATDLHAWVRSRLASYKAPARLMVVDVLPRNDLGKVVRRAALAMLEEAQESSAITSSVDRERK